MIKEASGYNSPYENAPVNAKQQLTIDGIEKKTGLRNVHVITGIDGRAFVTMFKYGHSFDYNYQIDIDGNIIRGPSDEELKADEIFIQKEDKKMIGKVITMLSIIQREVIILKYVNEMSLSEVSEILQMPKNTVKSHHRRALI